MRKGETILRWVGVAACEAFAAFTVVWLLVREQYGRLPMAAVTLLLVVAPLMAERLLRCTIALPVFLFEKFADPQRLRRWMTAVFALCFSMAVAVGWEFFEYGMDTLFGMDMQDDTVITTITSYLLDGEPGKAGTIRAITAVTVNGKPLPVKGYIDIGLNDTMWDMILETLGALAVVVWYLWDRGRHTPFRER